MQMIIIFKDENPLFVPTNEIYWQCLVYCTNHAIMDNYPPLP